MEKMGFIKTFSTLFSSIGNVAKTISRDGEDDDSLSREEKDLVRQIEEEQKRIKNEHYRGEKNSILDVPNQKAKAKVKVNEKVVDKGNKKRDEEER